MNKKNLTILVLISLGIIFFIYQNYSNSPSDVHSVILTENGFSPKEINIHKGDTVIFTSTTERDFWPASDLHPTHTIYPEFDPREPVPSSKSWTFKFDKVGSWKFHDHLFPSQRGVINVVDGKSSNSKVDCKTVSGKEQCWEAQIKETLDKQGLNSAFDLLANLYSIEPDFASECHSYVHILGTTAYEIFSKHQNLEISSKSSYCGFGFYHGFMEALLQKGGNIEDARKFCAYIGDKLKNETSDAEGACYHGIGHGAVDGSDPRFWGDPQGMIAPSLKMCEQVAGNDRGLHGKLYRCVSGAYNAIEILSMDPKYKITQISQNPFYLCPNQPFEYKEACYTNMLPALLRFTGQDFTKSAKIIEQIKEDESIQPVFSEVMLSLFHEFIRVNLNIQDYNVKAGVSICRELSSRSHLPCIEGLSGGHMKYGEPTKEYVKGLAFCNSDVLQSDEKEVCFQYILSRLRIWYGVSEVSQICQNAPADYRKYCS